MKFSFNLRSYTMMCLCISAMVTVSFVGYNFNTFEQEHNDKVATIKALNNENYQQHKLIMNAMRSLFKSSTKVKEKEFVVFTQALLGTRDALVFTLTPELKLAYISDDKFAEELQKLEVNLDQVGSVQGQLPGYQLIMHDIDEPNMPYLVYAIPLSSMLFNINKLKDTCLKYTSPQISVKSDSCVNYPISIISAWFSYHSEWDIRAPTYNFYTTLGIDTQVAPVRIIRLIGNSALSLLICAVIFVLLYFELEKKRLFRRLARENKLNVAMVSSINHEIRTPINALLGYSQVLKDMPKISKEHSVVIDKMLWSANLLHSVAENTLNYSKSATGSLVLNNAPINISHYINNINDYYTKLSIPADKTLAFHVRDNLPAVISIDSSKLFQLMTNMINNALKYSTGEAVHCHVDICQRRLFNDYSSLNRSDYLRILIQDSGEGLSKSVKELLTNPFAESSAQFKKVSGIGLGIYTCNQLLTQVGGKFRLHSVKNEGTKIMLHFPLESVSSTALKAMTAVDYSSTRILIVDDNYFNLEVCNAMLEDKAFKTVCADNSKDAMSIFVDSKPDVVIVDYQLDEMNGLELITAMKCKQGNTDTQYFILSANDKNEIVGSECYPDIYFIQKPFNTAIFLSCLQQAC